MKSTRREWIRAAGVAGTGVALARPARPERTGDSAAALLEVFPQRQSVRRYKSDPVPEEHVRMILDAARRAPTCMNQQPWKFLVIRDPAKIGRMKQRVIELTVKTNDPAARQKAIAAIEGYFSAPVYVVVLTDNQCFCGPEYAKHDGPLAAGYLMLAARALGYGTVYLTDSIPDSVTLEVLNIPARYHRVCVTPIGVPDGWPPPKPKKKLEELVAYETL